MPTVGFPLFRPAMLFLLLMYSLNFGGASARPITLLEQRTDTPCNDLNNCRTRWNIIWSCLSTVFLCTWVTLHPNIAIAPDTRRVGWIERSVWHPLRFLMKNRLPLFLCALVAPEYILAWAIRQYIQAGEIQRQCHASQTNTEAKGSTPVREWKRAHGFFLIMGGFHLFTLPDGAPSIPYPPESSISVQFVLPLPGYSREDEKAEHPLGFDDLSPNTLAYFAPTEREIKDRGKADAIAKLLALLQTSWFVAQCIARRVNNLPLTELEVVTLAYGMMNVFIYYFWWDKPKEVECPIRIYKTSKTDRSKMERRGRKQWNSVGERQLFFRVFIYLVGQALDVWFTLSEDTQVPMFWSGNLDYSIVLLSTLGAMTIGMGFGAIHFIAWNSEFPSNIEPLLWRIEYPPSQ